MTKTIVILGGGFAAMPIAHYLLKHTAAKLTGGLKVVIISPNTHVYWVFASVRGILPNMLPEDKLFYPIDEGFAKYPKGQFEHILGAANRLVPESNSVLVRRNDGAEQTISYDYVIIATGSSYIDTPFKDLGTTQQTKAALREWSKKIESAKSIVVAGAGYTGVELVGELGEEYAYNGLKDITFLVDKELPFTSEIKTDVRSAAKKELENLKVKVLVNSRVTKTSKNGAKTVIEVNNGAKTVTADLFIPTFGIKPNTSFMPAELLDASGYVKQAPSLRVPGHNNVYVVGDAGSLQEAKALTTDFEINHLVKTLDGELLNNSGDVGDIKVDSKVIFATSIGKSRGTGQFGNWRLWSFLVWWMKSRNLGTDYGRDYVAGLRTLSQKKW